MVTRFRVETNRPTERLNLHVSLVSSLPKSYHDAFSDPNWQNAMRDDYHALIKNKTWILVPRPSDTNIVCCMWLFCHKYLADGKLSRYKARLVANASSEILLQQIMRSLHQEFAMKDLGLLNYFLGISVTRDSSGLFLSQKKYAVEVLEREHMVNCNPNRTPIDTESKLGSDDDLVSDPTLYRSLACSLQYLTFTRSDISYAVQQVCLYIHDPREPHFAALKRIMRYVRGTLDYGLQLFSSSTTDLVAYSDADWADYPTTRRSTSGYRVFLGNNLLSWSSKRQPTLSRSSAEAEYRGVANAVAETCWLHNLLRELHTPLSFATLVYCDNVSVVYLSCNPVQHQRTKHIEIKIHFVRDLVAAGQVRVLHVWSLVRRFDEPQKYKPFVSRCTMQAGDLNIGSVRQVNVKSGLPATTSTERLELLDDDEHILGIKIVDGDHRLKNYSSILTVHPEIIEERSGTLVIESFVVDIPDGNTNDETCYFVKSLINCNLNSLSEVSERMAVQNQRG
ncbi:ribonuclease H-like domain-containing protein [Tanacetum coccineum]